MRRIWPLTLLFACSDPQRDPHGDAAPDQGVLDARVLDARVLDARVLDARGAEPATPDASIDPVRDAAAIGNVRLPPANAGLDYQLGGAYPPPSGVAIVTRDRRATPAPGLYNICYVNGFQAQADEADTWLSDHPTLILRDGQGQPVIDRDWNEMLLDVSSADKRAQLENIVGAWITGCAASGFDAVEVDNLDSYTRSGGRLHEDDAVAFLALLSARAHSLGLALAQKNSSELAARRRELGSDFAVAEECSRYDECETYISAYGSAVLMIEYRSADFQRGCAAHPDFSIVLRDLDLVSADSQGYVFEDC